jgi:1,4-alpha-glucan branching enzyme
MLKFIFIILFCLTASCVQKLPTPEVLSNGIRFSFFAPSAKSVAIAGSFNRWNPENDKLTGPDKKGVWRITLPLSEGRYEYRFIINDSEWVLDPSIPSVDDGLGGENSILIISP